MGETKTKRYPTCSPVHFVLFHQPLCSLTNSALISNRENAVWNCIESNYIIMFHEKKCMSEWVVVQEKYEQLGFHCWVMHLNPESCPTLNTILLNYKFTNDKEASWFGSMHIKTETYINYWKGSRAIVGDTLCPTSQFLSPWLAISPGSQGSAKKEWELCMDANTYPSSIH